MKVQEQLLIESAIAITVRIPEDNDDEYVTHTITIEEAKALVATLTQLIIKADPRA